MIIWLFCDFCFVFVSENKYYDDDDDDKKNVFIRYAYRASEWAAERGGYILYDWQVDRQVREVIKTTRIVQALSAIHDIRRIDHSGRMHLIPRDDQPSEDIFVWIKVHRPDGRTTQHGINPVLHSAWQHGK